MAILEWRLYEAGFCTHPERATRRDAGLQACEFPALVPVLRHAEHGWILFDTGYSEHFLQATSALPERLYRMVTPVHLRPQATLASQLRRDGVAPADVAWVLLSHMHGDHVGGLADFLVADASWSSQAIRDNVPPPAAVTGWLGDTTTYRETLARLHALHRASPEVRIVPSHCRDWRPSREPRA